MGLLIVLLVAAVLALLVLPEFRSRPLSSGRRSELFRHPAFWIAVSIAASLALSLVLGGRAIVLLGALPLLGLFGSGKAGRDQSPPGRPAPRLASMTRDDAYAVLGLAPGASIREIESAYARLRARIDPGHGGSAWLAAELDQAREILLADRDR